jgi:hypothetical protein
MVRMYLVMHVLKFGPFHIVTRIGRYTEERPTMAVGVWETQVVLAMGEGRSLAEAEKALDVKLEQRPGWATIIGDLDPRADRQTKLVEALQRLRGWLSQNSSMMGRI